MLVDLPTTRSWGDTISLNIEYISHVIARGPGGAWVYLAPKAGAPYWVSHIERVPIELARSEVAKRIKDARRGNNELV